MEGALKDLSELHSILREKYPTTNFFVDPSGGEDGPCFIESFGDFAFKIQIAYDHDGIVYVLYGLGDERHEYIFNQETMLARIAKLVKKVTQ